MSSDSRPNILIFFVDQMLADFVRDGHPCQMPHLRRFAAEGLSFHRAFTSSPHCCPSRATFMSGLYPSRHGIYNNVNTNTSFQKGLNPGVKLFSEFLHEAGYRMAHAGKWHVSDEQTPADRGWQEYSEYRKHYLTRNNTEWLDLARRPPEPGGPRPEGMMLRPGWLDERAYGKVLEGPDAYERAPWYKDGVAPGLKAVREMAGGEGPWCVCISTDMGHTSAVPKEFRDLYDAEKIALPPSYADRMRDKPRIYHRMRRQYWDQLSEKEARQDLAHYYALCSLQDRYFGDILETLEATGQRENTFVLFLADHGEYGYAHGLTNMGIPSFREAYHVPAIVRWPGGLRHPNRVVDEFVSLADFAPTFLDLAGVDTDYDFTGRSLLPFLRGEPAPADWPDAWFSQTKGNECYYTQRIVMTAKYKFVANWFDYDELYDLENDPHEMVNLAFPKEADFDAPPGGESSNRESYVPWPPLSPELDAVRKKLMGRIWRFAFEQNDIVFNSYPPVAIPSYGPLVGARDLVRQERDGDLNESG